MADLITNETNEPMNADDFYYAQATVTKIQASSRASIKVKDSFYTIEYSEERTVPDRPDVEIEIEREILWNTVNNEVDNQIQDILNAKNT